MRVLSCLLFCGLALAQSQRPPVAEPANLPAQKIGPNDLIAITVYDSPEFSRPVRVGADGTIRLPLLRRAVQAEGLMPTQLERAVADALKAEQLIVDPFVTVAVSEYSSRPISVAGAVKSPLTFQALSPVTLLEAITRAGGLSAEAGPEILVSRKQPAGEGEAISAVQRISVRALIDAADREANIQLSGGEEIRVPEVRKVFVVGNVKKPGSYPVQDGAETTVLKILALSEGLSPFAGKVAYIYRREADAGKKTELPIELGMILERKAPDVPLLPEDILYVPENGRKRARTAALDKMLLFGSGATAALIYGIVR